MDLFEIEKHFIRFFWYLSYFLIFISFYDAYWMYGYGIWFQELERKRKERSQVVYERKKQLTKLRVKALKTAEEKLGSQLEILAPITYWFGNKVVFQCCCPSNYVLFLQFHLSGLVFVVVSCYIESSIFVVRFWVLVVFLNFWKSVLVLKTFYSLMKLRMPLSFESMKSFGDIKRT